MTEPFGYAVLQLIPSLDGVSKEVDRQLSGMPGLGRSVGKKVGDGIASGVGDGMKAAEKAVETSTRKIEQLKDKVANSTDAARLAEQRYQEAVEKGVSGSRLTAAANAQEKALRQEATLTRELTRETERLERAQKDLASSAGAEQGGESAGSAFLEGFTGGVAALGTKAGPIGAGIMAAGAVALAGGAFLGQQLMAGLEREVASDRIAAQLGLNDAEMARFGQVAGRTYAGNFGESMGDIGDALAAVTSTLGRDMPADALESMTQKALTFRDVFGTDVAESVAFAQNLIVNGLAPNAESAFDMMVTAYQRVPAAMRDELPEILSEYSTYFQSLGFSGEEAFGLLVNTAPKGQIALDKLGDSLKEFTLLATDIGAKPVQDAFATLGMNNVDAANNLLGGGEGAQRQFDAIIDGLLSIQSPAEQAAAAIALFGTPLEDLDKAKIPEFLRSLDDGQRAMDGFAGSAQGMVETAGDNAAGSVESAKRAVELAVGDLQASLGTVFGPVVEDWANTLSEHKPQITNFFVDIADIAIQTGQGVLGGMSTAVGAIATFAMGLGDAYGGLTRVHAAAQRLIGRDELADQLDAEADKAFGFGEGLMDLADGMINAAREGDRLRSDLQRLGDEASGAADKHAGTDRAIGRVGDSAGTAAVEVKRLNDELAKTPAGMPWLTPGGPPVPGQGTPGYNPLNPSGVYGNVPPPPGGGGPGFTIPPLSSGPGGGVGPDGRPVPGQSFGAPAGLNTAPSEEQVKQIAERFGLKVTSEDRPGDDGYHGRGMALDISNGSGNTPEMQAFAEYMSANFGPTLKELIYDAPGWTGNVKDGKGTGAFGNVYTMDQAGNHQDHVHIAADWGGGAPVPLPTTGDTVFTASAHGSNEGSGGLSGSLYQDADGRWRSRLPAWDHLIQRESSGVNQRQGITDVNSGGNEAEGLFQITPATWRAHGGTKYAPSALSATPQEQAEIAAAIFGANPDGSDWGAGLSGREDPNQLLSELQGAGTSQTVQGPIDPRVMNAYGPGYEPGIGTPGFDEFGEPGYYEVDPKQVREAEQRIDDQTERIREADEAARQAQVAIDELEADADQSERDAAIERKRKADYDAEVARRELGDLQAELSEAQQGKFSPAKEATESAAEGRGRSSSSGLSLPSSFSGFGSAIGEFAGGQIGSALEVFGVPDSPSWLGAASQLLGGLKVGGDDRLLNGQLSGKSDGSLFDGGNMFGGSAAPLSAIPNLTGTPPPDDAGSMHGSRAGQQPGPVYNITARDTEDAFIRAQRVEREKSAAKLARF